MFHVKHRRTACFGSPSSQSRRCPARHVDPVCISPVAQLPRAVPWSVDTGNGYISRSPTVSHCPLSRPMSRILPWCHASVRTRCQSRKTIDAARLPMNPELGCWRFGGFTIWPSASRSSRSLDDPAGCFTRNTTLKEKERCRLDHRGSARRSSGLECAGAEYCRLCLPLARTRLDPSEASS